MTGHIISLHGDLHDDACALLPWYVTGQLDDEDTARIEAHLPQCAQCQADLAGERRLQAALGGLREPVGDADAGFEALRDRLAPRSSQSQSSLGQSSQSQSSQSRQAAPRRTRLAQAGRQWRNSAPWMRWAMAAQLALLALAAAALVVMTQRAALSPAPQYHTLGAAPDPAAANIVVVFRPDIRESELRQTLRDNRARLVGGPTAADAYLLHVDAADRTATVDRLRHQSTIVLAEPVDAGEFGHE